MDAVFKISGEEFDEALFKKIKALLKKGSNSSVVIHVVDEKQAYKNALNKSIAELNNPDELISFAMEELVAYKTPSKKKSK